MLVKCKCCGAMIDHVNVDFFNVFGDDAEIPCSFDVHENGAVELDVDSNWTGYELDDDEEREKTISCPHCGKFPFADQIQVYEIVRVVMFTEN